MMKGFKIALITVFAALIACFCVACDPRPVPALPKGKATVVDSDSFTLLSPSRTAVADENGEVTFEIKLRENYFVDSVDWSFADVENSESGSTIVTLRKVSYPILVEISCLPADVCITYDFNGGSISGETSRRIGYNLFWHKYPNTFTAAELEREGYLFTGWNTKRDASGEHIGAGSRFRSESDDAVLYAEWEKCTSSGDFAVREKDGKAEIVGYNGTGEKIVVPEKINGLPVTAIGEGAFKDCAAKAVYLPKSMTTVGKGAFENCAFTELYMFDNVMTLGDSSFVSCGNFRTLHINAYLPPRYPKYDRHSIFADKYDLLYAAKSKKKIVVFGGSGAYFSVSAKQIEEAFGGKYAVINMAVNAHYNLSAQLDMIRPYMKAGDVLLHIPEAASDEQIPIRTDMYDERIIQGAEENYDLFSQVDLRKISGVFDAFEQFNEGRKDLEPCEYSDGIDFITANGDYSREKPARTVDGPISEEADILLDWFDEPEVVNRLNGYYESFTDKGVRVLVANAAVNYDQLVRKFEQKQDNYIFRWDAWLQNSLGVDVILPLSECLYHYDDMFNSDYHLSDEATVVHTDKIIARLKGSLGR